jgi:hypothetical protein
MAIALVPTFGAHSEKDNGEQNVRRGMVASRVLRALRATPYDIAIVYSI